MKKRLLGILITVLIFGVLAFLIVYDYSSHADGDGLLHEIIHYVVHILVCVTFCTLFHNPIHDFSNWVKNLIGFKHKKDNCPHK